MNESVQQEEISKQFLTGCPSFMATGVEGGHMRLNDEILLVAILAFAVYLLFVVIIDRYS